MLVICQFLSLNHVLHSNNPPQNYKVASPSTTGAIEGYITNGSGLTIADAIVGIDGVTQTTSDPTGYYILTQIPQGNSVVQCFKDGYNLGVDSIIVIPFDTVNLDFSLTQPYLTLTPLLFDVTLPPYGYQTEILSILNTGDGPCQWNAEIIFPSKKSSSPTNTLQKQFGFIDYTGMNVSTIPKGNGKALSSQSTMTCEANSVFSNQPVNSDNGYTADESYGYMCYQSFGGFSDKFDKVTIWAIHTSTPSGQRELLVEVYGPGNVPGAIESSTITLVDPVPTGIQVIGYDTYSYTVDIPVSDLDEGWIGVQATSGGSPSFYWLNTYSTPVFTSMQNNSVLPASLSMCLSSSVNTSWLTLGEYQGTVDPGGNSELIDVIFNAFGTEVGEVYTADIVITTTPDVGTFNIPVTMTIAGDPMCMVYDLQATYSNMITPNIFVSWNYIDSCANFQFFSIARNGTVIGTTTEYMYSDTPPTFGDYCYTITPYFSAGSGIPATTCVEWEFPQICHDPDTLYNEQWINSQEMVQLEIENCGEGVLHFLFPDYPSKSRFACDMEIALHDTYGDGWNGGSLDVFVNGNLVLDDITLTNGSGPEYFSFPVEDGDDISTVYTAGDWPYENWYEFYDGQGNLIYTAGNESIPEGIVFGTCYPGGTNPEFVIDVTPNQGFVPENQTVLVNVTYDATDFPNGLYHQHLYYYTNVYPDYEDSIYCEMLVYTPGSIEGTITDGNTGLPLLGVKVSAGDKYTFSKDDGTYNLFADAGSYDVEFSLLGYETVVVSGVTIAAGGVSLLDASLVETPYPVPWVTATPINNGTSCLVEWGLPMGPYEIIYDDGDANDYVIWTEPGNYAAVQFSTVGYPATIKGAKFYIGDGTFPSAGNFLGSQQHIVLIDDDGANGMPGTPLDTAVIVVNDYGWVEAVNAFNYTIDTGDFFIALLQVGYLENSIPLGVDTDPPTVYRSYVKMNNAGWTISPYQDFMIRAIVDGPNAGVVSSSSGKKVVLPKVTDGPFLATSPPDNPGGIVKDGEINYLYSENNSRALTNYTIARVSNFDPDLGPQTGTLTILANPISSPSVDAGYGGLTPGFYAYAIKAVYESNESNFVYSNVIGNGISSEVTIVVSTCDDTTSENSEVALYGMDYPYDIWTGTTDISGIVVFDSVIDGMYDLFISKVGYVSYGSYSTGNPPFLITNDTTIGVELLQNMYPPTNLVINPLTSVASWEGPFVTALPMEDFEDEMFPPEGWQAFSPHVGWYRSDDGSGGDWTVPPGDGYYAVSNCATSGSWGNNRLDYLITPELDLRESDYFELIFDSYYDGGWGQLADVEYSYDNGVNWYVLEPMSPHGAWHELSVDLSPLSGITSEPVRLAFHSDGLGTWSSGWAVDNVKVQNGPAPVLAYYVFLDNVFMDQTSWDITSYVFPELEYGTEYEACVTAVYECGASEFLCETWTSAYLYPPRNLTHEYINMTDEVPLLWNPPSQVGAVPSQLLSFNVFRDSIEIANVPYTGQGVDDWIMYIDTAVPSNDYTYWVSGVYDITDFGFSNETAESYWNGPVDVSVAWGSTLPFDETWDNGTFTFNGWILNENSANWGINSQQGNPEPSAEFTWDPLLENGYSSTLTSYPIVVDYITEGDLYLSFDLELVNRNTTGDEMMLIEVFDGYEWNLVAEFNNSSKIQMDSVVFNITDYAWNNSIQIRFNASGENSFDIISWFVDNIHVFRECGPPKDLTGEPTWLGGDLVVELCWDASDITMPLAEWVHWDSGETISGIGLTNGGTFSCAARWDESQVLEYSNGSIEKVRLSIAEGMTELVLKIWNGDHAANLIYEENITEEIIIGEWNEIVLSNPIPIEENKELWVGYTITHESGTFSAATDAGPAVVYHGDMISTDGSSWESMASAYGLNYNWNIQFYVNEEVAGIPISPLPQTGFSNKNSELAVGPQITVPIEVESESNRTISGFNIYRMVEGEPDYSYYDFEPMVSGQFDYCYHDYFVNTGDAYFYKVTANYVSETDFCESDPASALEIPDDDFVYVLFENISEAAEKNILVYPNPANDKITISSEEKILEITVMSINGKMILSEQLNSYKTQMETAQLDQGIYIIRSLTEKGEYFNKVVIQH